MKKVYGVLMTLALVALMSTLAFAQDQTKATAPTSDFIQTIKTTWVEFKEKAHSYWSNLMGTKERAPSSAPTTEPAPVVAVAVPASPVTHTEKTNSAAVVIDNKLPAPAVNAAVVTQLQQLKQTYQEVKSAQTHTVTKVARLGVAKIPKSKSGVPVFTVETVGKSKHGKQQVMQVKSIPYLDIGTEAQISHKLWDIKMPELAELKLQDLKKYESVSLTNQKELNSILLTKLIKAFPAAKIQKIKLGLPEDVNMESVQKAVYKIASEFVVKESAYKSITDDQMNLLKALILAEYNKKCHLAIGYFQTLPKNFSEEENQLKSFYTASCMHELGFYSDSVPALLEVIKKGIPQFVTSAIDMVTKDLPREYAKEVGTVLKTVNETFVSDKSKNLFNYYIALSEAMKKKHEVALAYAIKVRPETAKYPEAQYIAVVSEYMMDNIKASQTRQEKLLIELPKYKVEPPLAALIKLNLGRIAYRNKDYKKAIENYQFIDKDSPLWIQALTEQGWMQVLAQDPFGAIGNMHSLQSPYFDSIYKPESYVVRTIGYLNICQYGDAYKSLTYLEKFYKPWIASIDSFKKSNTQNSQYYEFVIGAFKTKGKGIDGKLPMTIIKEMSRHKDFVNLQASINNTVDQNSQYGFIRDLIKKDQKQVETKISQVQRRILDLNAKIDGIKRHPDDQKNLAEWKKSREFEKRSLQYDQFEKLTYFKSATDYKLYEGNSSKNLARWAAKFKEEAGESLKTNLAKIEKSLAKILENNEFLRYEIFAGSGENIRYVSAGGQTGGKMERRLSVGAEPKIKNQNWDFDGEFWADEIGHYRSSLKDNCPQSLSQNKNVK